MKESKRLRLVNRSTPIFYLSSGLDPPQRSSGCSVISDMSSFTLLRKEHELFEYERAWPSRLNSMKYKQFCCYHQADFDRL
jgi:hypothetical protein